LFRFALQGFDLDADQGIALHLIVYILILAADNNASVGRRADTSLADVVEM
jgi:hypothetical protein